MNLPDQSDLLARLGTTETALASVKAELVTLKTEHEASSALLQETADRLSAATQERDNARADVTKLTEERDHLAAQLETVKAERNAAVNAKTAAEAQLTDFNTRVAAEVNRLGLGKVPAPAFVGKDPKTLTPTERVLMAKGVSSLEELNRQ